MDTMWLMGLEDEFKESLRFVSTFNVRDRDLDISLFETTIRVLGGLLGAYELSRDAILLKKADEIGQRLLRAFDSDSCLPYPSVNLKTGFGRATWGAPVTTLAEIGSLQLEFEYLSHHLKKHERLVCAAWGGPCEYQLFGEAEQEQHRADSYSMKAQQITRHLRSLRPRGGLYPLHYDLSTGNISTRFGFEVTFGGSADSFYEYLLKLWMLTGKRDAALRRQYDESMDGLVSYLVYESVPEFATDGGEFETKEAPPQKRHPLSSFFVAEWHLGVGYVHEMEHLACFLPGLLMLGADSSVTDEPENAARDRFVARELMETCFDLYACQHSGLAPESVVFPTSSKPGARVPAVKNPSYMLRPETLESLFVMWRLTHNVRYRNMAWKIFQAIDAHCKTDTGYSGLHSIHWHGHTPPHDDLMQGYFFSETLKYAFLIFSDDSLLDLSKYVLNTEAHPLAIFS